MNNYAIVPCAEADIQNRAMEPGNRRILAIFYPEGQYESVRIILERFLEVKDPTTYKSLGYYSSKYQSNEEKTTEQLFGYDSPNIGFFGREEEIDELKQFCDSPDVLKWWAVTGEGGSGKSKLVLKICFIRQA